MANISIIVPVYKVENYLSRCIDSILRQSYSDYELILVDDGSPDNCGAICDEYAKKDSRIHVIHQRNAGLSAARNAGIEWVFANNDSQWLTFIDSDDWVHSAYLETLYEAVSAHHVRISMCEAQHMRAYSAEHLKEKGISIALHAEEAYVSRYGMAMMAWGKLYHRSCFGEIRFPVGRLHEDAFTVYRMLFSCDRVAVCDTPFYYYYYNAEGITHSQWNERRLDEVEAHEEQIQYLKGNCYDRALHTETLVYLRVLARHIVEANKEYVKNRVHVKRLRKKLGTALTRHRRQCEYPISGNEWVYEAAYPTRMKAYWLLNALIRKLRLN